MCPWMKSPSATSLVIFPHEICPVDGTVVAGSGVMDESYLTGEPYMMSKTPGSAVLSGAINGDSALTIRADKRAVDSRYAKIMEVMRASEQRRPRLRRLGDQLGAVYTPVAVAIALAAWAASGESLRFLAVLVVATPCPLLIAIPVAIIGSISLSARRGIIIKDPAVLEKIATCRTAIFDKTGTLTYGRAQADRSDSGLRFRRDRGARAGRGRWNATRSTRWRARSLKVVANRRGRAARRQAAISERPGDGLLGTVAGRTIEITSRKKLLRATSFHRAGTSPRGQAAWSVSP